MKQTHYRYRRYKVSPNVGPIVRQLELAMCALGCAVFLVLSAQVTFGELSPFIPAYASVGERIDAIARKEVRTGISSYSRTARLNDCIDGLISSYGMAQSTEHRSMIIDACDGFTRNILAAEPSNAYVWYVSALIAAETKNSDRFNHDFVMSHRMAPNELWLALLRVDLVHRFKQFDPSSATAYAADVGTMAGSRVGARALARAYIKTPGSRGRIAGIVDTLPSADQERFLTWVDREVAALGTLR